MTNWVEFIVALLAFLLSHMIPVRPAVRGWLIARLGRRTYLTGYSVFSLLLLIWLISATGRAPYLQVLPDWTLWRWVAVIAMVPVCVLVVAGLKANNPFSFGGLGRTAFDPDRPGVLSVTRHPLLLALAIWSLAHALANGDLAHLILFGLFAGFAGLGMVMIDRRKARDLPNWPDLSRNTARLALVAWRPDPVTLVLAALLYTGLFLLHPIVIGMPILI